jgi:hypothetical protein
MSRFYRMHDAEPCGMISATPDSLEHWNRRGFGIFATVQKFQGPRRIENLVAIQAWAVDLDGGDKAAQRRRLLSSPLIPSSVVETKNGYHAYWYAIDARADRYRAIVGRLVEYFGGDPNARDLARVLRVPGFLHQKDPADPFLVGHAWGPHREIRYHERQLAQLFPPSHEELEAWAKQETPADDVAPSRVVFPADKENFWERAFDIDCMEGLRRLSGSSWVNGERFDFKPQRNGNTNLTVNGKGIAAFIDSTGRIGSGARGATGEPGGPSLYRWLRWYGHSKQQCAEILKQAFPELEETA